MQNYFRITAYHPEKNVSVIMDAYGMFEKLWQFSSFIVQKGFKIIAVGNGETFTDGNIEKDDTFRANKMLLRACATGNALTSVRALVFLRKNIVHFPILGNENLK